MLINFQNRPFTAVLFASSGAFAMAMGQQPLIWIAITCVLGFVLGWVMPRWWFKA